MIAPINIINLAAGFARRAHEGQVRKYTGEPYFKHLFEVAQLLSDHGASNANIIAAGYLHDTLEDTATTQEELLRVFGTVIKDLVLQVTDVSKASDGNRKVRKKKDLDHLAKSTPPGASIKLADIISNTQSIVMYDRNFAKTYIPEKEALLTVLKHGHPGLYKKAWVTVRTGRIMLDRGSQN